MKIKINKPSEIVFYPEIGDNLELKEDKRFAFVLKRPSRFLLLEPLYSKAKTAKLDYIKAFLVDIKNPITLEDDGKDRPFTEDDLLLPVDEIEQITTQLYLKCIEISKDAIDSKK